jgi:hypothetical protein
MSISVSLSLSHKEMFPGMEFKVGPARWLGQLGDSGGSYKFFY